MIRYTLWVSDSLYEVFLIKINVKRKILNGVGQKFPLTHSNIEEIVAYNGSVDEFYSRSSNYKMWWDKRKVYKSIDEAKKELIKQSFIHE